MSQKSVLICYRHALTCIIVAPHRSGDDSKAYLIEHSERFLSQGDAVVNGYREGQDVVSALPVFPFWMRVGLSSDLTQQLAASSRVGRVMPSLTVVSVVASLVGSLRHAVPPGIRRRIVTSLTPCALCVVCHAACKTLA